MLTYNNTKIETLKFGNTDIETGIFNGVTVFEKRQENTVILRTTKQSIGVEVVTQKGSDLEVWNAGEKRAVFESGNNCTITLKDTEQDVIIKGHDIIRLFCSDPKLTSLNAQGCTALQVLVCNDTELTSLNVQGCTALQALPCYNTQLTSLNVQGLTALQELPCYNSQLTSLNAQGCTALETLSCNDTQLTSLNAQGCTALQELTCYNSQLTSLNVQGCTALQELTCYNSQLTANAFKDIFINLAKTNGKGAALLYNDGDSNYKDFTQPPELARAFDMAKAKGWKFYKNSPNNENLL